MSGTATLTVVTTGGIELYGTGDMATANFAAGSVHSSTEAYAVNTGTGHTFHYIGTGFTYDANNNFTGGQISEIDILSNANSATLVTMVFDGGTIDADALNDAFDAFKFDFHNGSQVTALFNAFAFNAQGNVGNDVLSSYALADTFVGGGGPGSTNDGVSYLHSAGPVTASLADPGVNTGAAAGDTYTDIWELIGTDYDDTLIGDGNINRLEGGAGADHLIGGGSGQDYAGYRHATSGVTASLADSSINTGDAAGDTYSGIFRLDGTNYNDVLFGDNNGNFLRGRAGADELHGGGGFDFADYTAAPVGVWADLSDALSNRGHAAGDSYYSIEGLRGSELNDTLKGDEGNNTLIGQTGADRFIYSNGTDIITDFKHSEGDKIDLTGSGVADWDTLQGLLTPAGFNTIIDFETDHSITLNDVAVGDLTANDFIFDGKGIATLTVVTPNGFTWFYTGDIGNANPLAGGTEHDDTLSQAINFGTNHGYNFYGTGFTYDEDNNFTGGIIGAIDIYDSTFTTLLASVEFTAAINAAELSAAIASFKADPENSNAVSLLFSDFDWVEQGGTGDDLLPSYHGADSFVGGGGFDAVSYLHSDEGVTASLTDSSQNTGAAAGDTYSGIWELIGTNHDDKLTGGVTQSRLEGGAGADTLIGGATGTDYAGYQHATVGLTASLADPHMNTGDATGDSYTNIKRLVGTNFDDVLFGDGNGNFLRGRAGADELHGGGGFDFADYTAAPVGVWADLSDALSNRGHAAGDSYYSIEGLRGSDLNDTLKGDANGNTLIGQKGADTFIYSGGTDTITDFNLTGADGAGDKIDLAGSGVTDWDGLEGMLSANDGNAKITFGAGDTITLNGVTAANLTENDFIFDGAAPVTATATLTVVTTGGIELYGTGDMATANFAAGSVHSSTEAYAVNTGTGHTFHYIGTGFTYDANNNFTGGQISEIDILSNANSATLVTMVFDGGTIDADALNDAFDAFKFDFHNGSQVTALFNAFAFNAQGNVGNDVLSSYALADTFVGGGGPGSTNDGVSYLHSAGPVTASLADPGVNTGAAAGDTYTDIWELIGTDYDDTLIGDGNINRLEGGAGADHLIGGGSGQDYAGYRHATSGVTASLADSSINTGDAAGDTYSGIFRLDGTNYNDVLFGDNNGNFLRGRAGADELHGGGGFDFADYTAAPVGVWADLSDALSNRGHAAGDSYYSIEGLRGSELNDTLKGDEGNNTLIGQTGADRFIYSNGTDIITDFKHSEGDKIDLTGSGVADWDTLQGLLTPAGFNTIIDFETDHSITLNDVAVGDLTANDFIFDGKGIATLTVVTPNGFTWFYTGDIGNANPLAGGTEHDDTLSQAINFGTNHGYNFYGTGFTYDEDNNFTGGIIGAIDIYDSTFTTLLASVEFTAAINAAELSAAIASFKADPENSNAVSLLFSDFDWVEQGGTGDDLLPSYHGADSFVGGGGFDAVSYLHSDEGVTASLTDSSQNTGAAAGDTYSGIWELIGTNHDDKLTGGVTQSRLEGGAGADTLIGGATGTDYAGYQHATVGLTASLADPHMNTGDATGDSYTNIKRLVGTNFDDVLFGDGNGNFLRGRAGADELHGGGGFDFADYTAAPVGVWADLSDALSNRGHAAGDSYYSIEGLRGSDLNDTLKGDANGNTLIGQKGADTFIYSGGTDTITDFNLTGADGAGDKIDLAGSGVTDWDGLEGMLSANDGNAKITFGAGDTITLNGVTAANLTENDFIFDGAAPVTATATLTVVTTGGIELYGTGDMATANFAAGSVHSSTEAYAVNTGTGHTFHYIGTGFTYDANNNFTGGQISEIDILSNANSATLVTMVFDGGTIDADALNDAFDAFKFDFHNGSQVTALFNAFAFNAQGNVGNDVLSSYALADTFVGGGGPGSTNDGVSYLHSAGPVTASLADPGVNTGAAAGDTYTDIWELIGTDYDDTLIGDGNINRLEGGAGADHLIGGGSGQDYAGYRHATSGVTASLADSSINTGDAAGDTYSGIFRLDGTNYNDVLFGDNNGNFLRGRGGINELHGGGGFDFADYTAASAGVRADLSDSSNNTGVAAGDSYDSIEGLRGSELNDILKGDEGNNTLIGQTGADRFIYSGGTDTITDFNHGQGDKVDLTGSGVTDFTALQGLLSPNGGNAKITFGAGNTLILNDVVGTSLTASDFVFDADTLAPTVTAIVSTPDGGPVGLGQTVIINVTTSEAVDVTGTPKLTLSDKGIATYDEANSDPANGILEFVYTVGPKENTADLKVTALTLGNGITISDLAGNALNSTALKNADLRIAVDSTAPVMKVALKTDTGALKTDTITSDATLTGTGDANAIVNFNVDGNGIIATAHADAKGVWSISGADLNLDDGPHTVIASEIDAAGNIGSSTPLTFTLDTTAPTVDVDAVTSNPSSGGVSLGQIVSIKLDLGEALKVTGAPTLSLNSGATATYDAKSSDLVHGVLAFSYKVGANQATDDLKIDQVNVSKAVITDLAGNAVEFSGADGADLGLAIDTLAPTVTAIVSTPDSGPVGLGQTVIINVTTSEAVDVTGTPKLTLSDKGIATYDEANSDPANGILEFVYTVGPKENTADLKVTALTLGNGITISDLAGNALNSTALKNADLRIAVDSTAPVMKVALKTDTGALKTDTITSDATLTGTGDANAIVNFNVDGNGIIATAHADAKGVWSISGADLNLDDGPHTVIASEIDAAGNIGSSTPLTFTLDTTAPTVDVDAVTSNPSSGGVSLGQIVSIKLDLGEALKVTGAPTLSLNSGATATYDAKSSDLVHGVLAFSYKVGANQATDDLKIDQVNVSKAVITDLAGNAVEFSGADGADLGLAIDTLAPTVTAIVSTPDSGPVGLGQTVIINVTTSEAVDVTGTPKLTLSDKGIATYDEANSDPANGILEFVYTVGPKENTADLKVTALTLGNGITISDLAGNALNSTALKNADLRIAVDSTAPVMKVALKTDTGALKTDTITSDATLTGTGDANAIVNFNVDGNGIIATAHADAKGVWSISGADLNLDDGPHTVIASEIDAAGNIGQASVAFTLDGTAPTVGEVSGVNLGKTVAITLDLGEALKVTGAPALALDVRGTAGTATYDAKHSDLAHGILAFSYTVPAGQTISDLQIDHVIPGKAVVTDLAGNKVLDFSGADGTDLGLYGGAGNDIIGVSDLNRAHIDGGAGTDTLQLNGSGQTFDLTVLTDSKIQNIEAIDFTGSGDNQLDLGVHNLLNFSNTPNANFTGATTLTNHRMVIVGDTGDVLHLFGDQPDGGPDAVWHKDLMHQQVILDGSANGDFDFYDLKQEGNDIAIASVAVDHHVTLDLI